MNTLPDTPAEPNRLRDLSLPVRLVLALFLISVGYGYISALVQLHFQEAGPGKVLPDAEDVTIHYHGQPGMGQLEKLITAPETKRFNAGGTMRTAFFTGSSGWGRRVKGFAKERGLDIESPEPERRMRAASALEPASIVAWIHDGAKESTYNEFTIPEKSRKAFDEWLAREQPLLKDKQKLPLPLGVSYDEDTKTWSAGVSTILEERCVRCHKEGAEAGQIQLDTWEHVQDYIKPVNDPASRGLSYAKLAQSTHVHLLGFSMLYGLTGLFFACTGYPVLLRLIVAPLPLLAQIIDISFWWLARMDAPYGPMFAQCIIVSGAIVGTGLMLQIVLGLFALFGALGRIIIVAGMLAVAGGGHFFLKPIVDAQLEFEKNPKTVQPVEKK